MKYLTNPFPFPARWAPPPPPPSPSPFSLVGFNNVSLDAAADANITVSRVPEYRCVAYLPLSLS